MTKLVLSSLLGLNVSKGGVILVIYNVIVTRGGSEFYDLHILHSESNLIQDEF